MRISVFALSSGLFLLPLLPALAQTAPTYDLSTLEQGSVFEYETSSGTLTSSYLGFFGEAYVFSTSETQRNSNASQRRIGVSRTGQLLWTVSVTPEGIISYYASPNDGSFILGRCHADLVFATAVLASISVETTYNDRVWTHIETTSPLNFLNPFSNALKAPIYKASLRGIW